jgi:hypothetical protein
MGSSTGVCLLGQALKRSSGRASATGAPCHDQPQRPAWPGNDPRRRQRWPRAHGARRPGALSRSSRPLCSRPVCLFSSRAQRCPRRAPSVTSVVADDAVAQCRNSMKAGGRPVRQLTRRPAIRPGGWPVWSARRRNTLRTARPRHRGRATSVDRGGSGAAHAKCGGGEVLHMVCSVAKFVAHHADAR